MATSVRTALIGLVGNIKGPYQKNIRFFDLLSEIRRCGPKMKESLPYPTKGSYDASKKKPSPIRPAA